MLPPINNWKKNRSGDTEATTSPNLKVFNAMPEGIPKTMAAAKSVTAMLIKPEFPLNTLAKMKKPTIVFAAKFKMMMAVVLFHPMGGMNFIYLLRPGAKW